jgi:hypothetical protein
MFTTIQKSYYTVLKTASSGNKKTFRCYLIGLFDYHYIISPNKEYIYSEDLGNFSNERFFSQNRSQLPKGIKSQKYSFLKYSSHFSFFRQLIV